MDSNSKNNIYSVLVAGDIGLSIFDSNMKVEPYVIYKYNERSNIRKKAIDVYKKLYEKLSTVQTQVVLDFINLKLQDITEMTDEEYFESITEGMTFDKITGDALTTINPNGKYTFLREATIENALPLYNGKFECLISDLNLNETNVDVSKYEKQWDYMMSCSPIVKEKYISTYGDKETYVKFMSEPFFYNAFVSNETGWLEQGDENQVEWVLSFKERFLYNQPKDTKLKVYNFKK